MERATNTHDQLIFLLLPLGNKQKSSKKSIKQTSHLLMSVLCSGSCQGFPSTDVVTIHGKHIL
jgi:hypothetical protein